MGEEIMLKNYVVIQKLTRFVAVAGLIFAVMMTAVPAGTLFAAPVQQAAGPVAVNAACTTLQPDESASQDAWINQDKPDENKNDSELVILTESSKLTRPLIAFDLAGAVPTNAKVTSATLSLYIKESKNGSTTVRAHQVTDYWIESAVTWRYQDKVSTEEWTASGADFSATVLDSETFTDGNKDYWATFNVSAAAQSWAASPATNYGVILEASVSGSKTQVKFNSSNDGTASERPKLQVCWSVGVGITPDNLAQGTAGQNNIYAHTVTVTDFTSEPVGLSALSNQGWTVNIYKDVNGNGQKDAADTAITQTPAMGPNGSYKILVEVVVPANAPNGTKDITTVTATGLNNGTVATAKDTTLVGFPPVADPVLDGRRDPAYTQSLDSNTQDYCDASGKTLARLMTLYDAASPDYVWLVLEMDLAHADASYGANAHPSWAAAGKSQSLGNLNGSDKGRVILRNGNGSVVFDVTSDFVEDGMSTVSGWGSAGVTGGEGSVSVGSASQVAVESSIGYNLNRFCTSSSSCTVSSTNLFSTSPAVNADYTPVSSFFTDWQFPYLYEFRFDRAAFGSSGFGSATIDAVHISPNKTGSNEIPVTPCNGSIGDRVWQDNDGDKVQDSNESGLNGVMVNLYRDTGNGTFEPGSDLAINTRFTAGDGDYSFTGLGPGVYFVDVVNSTIPADYVLTTANEPLKVTLAKGENFKDADFGYRTVPDVIISKSLISSDPAPVGSQVEFSIRITNTGNTAIDVLPLEDIYDPTVLQFVSATPAQSTVSGGVIRWGDLTTTQGNLAVGASTTVTVRFQALKNTTVVRRATLLAGTNVNAPEAEPVVNGLLETDYTFVGRSDPAGNAPGNLYKYTGASMCYYAFVVDRSYNDNVYADNDDAYLLLDGWDGHDYGNLDGSDKAIFTVSGPSGTYTDLEMDYITESNGAYTVDFYDAPINAAKTSLWYNLNLSGWNGNGTSPQYINGDVEYHSPPYNWNDTSGQYWEWTMIYEFSIPKSSVGSDCGTVTLAGAHNSPSKDDDSLGMIGDYVWADMDAQGDQDANEVGIPNVRVNLYKNNTLVRTTETEPGTSGFYIFSNLEAGTYVVNVDESTLPPGYTLTTANEPKTVSLSAGQDYRNADFGYVPGQGTIGDRVYYDINGDGGLDNDGEPGINNVKVNLYQSACPGSGSPLRTQFTTGNGGYLFTMLPANTYCVNVDETTLPAGYSLTTANEPKQVALAQDENYLLADFGYRLQQTGKTCDVATVTGAKDQYGTDPGDVSDFACVGITVSTGLQIVKLRNGPDTVTVGDVVSYTIRVTNNGQGKLVTLPLEDAYDNTTLSFLGATPAPDNTTDDGVLNWSDLTASFGQDLDPTQFFDVVVRFRAIKTTAGNVRSAQFAGAPVVLAAPTAPTAPAATATVLGGVDLGNLPNYLFFFANGSTDANWQGATKGFVGNVAVDGIQAAERTSGGVPYAGTITTNDSTLSAWQDIVTQNSGQAFASTGKTATISGLESDLTSAFSQINGLSATSGYSSVSSTSLNTLNTQDGVAKTYVINITSGLSFSSKINITGDAGDIFILRWDTDGNPGNGYQGQVKPSSGGAIVPLGGLKATNFINVAGDINASGGGSTPSAPYPQGPRLNDGTGALITGASDFSGGGYFTGYWLTTGDPSSGDTASLSNGIFVGGWYTLSDKFSMTSGTSGVYVSPPVTPTPPSGTIGDRVWYDSNGNAAQDGGESGINGVTVKLYAGACPISGSALQSKATTGDGGYLFTGLAAGNYCVDVDNTTVPATYNLTTANDPLSVNLATNSSNFLTADFGYKAPAVLGGTIGDRVWYDTNRDAAQQPTEPGINGVTVKLYAGTCPASGGAINSAVTTGNGTYLFTNLAAGNYCVDVDNATVPTGYNLTTANDPKTVNLPTGTSSFLDADFGYLASCPDGTPNVASSFGAKDEFNQTPSPAHGYACVEIKDRGAIGDFVWYDTNKDGIEDVGEPGIPNVTLDLYRDTDGTPGLNTATDTKVASTVTDADGGYLFTNLLPGTYFVDVTDLNGKLTGLTHTVLNQSVSDPSPAIVLPSGGVYKDADFGYVKESDPGKALVGDTVWFDDNGDGVQQPSEPGIPGVTVTIYNSAGTPIGTATTDSNGRYLVQVPAGSGYTASPTAGVPAGLTATTPVPHKLPTLNAGDQYLDADFGYNDPGNLLGTIGNLVFEDVNKDGVFTLGTDRPMPGISVDLIRNTTNNNVWDAGEPVITTMTTDKNGNYLFTGVPAGNYLVHVSDTNALLINYAKGPLGTAGVDTNSQADPYAITLAAGADNLTADFGYVKINPNLGQIGNQVWTEVDGNGLFDPTVRDVGQAGVTVDLYRNGGYYATTTTGASGDYSFVKLPSGTYTVTVSDNFGVLAGWVVTTLGPNQSSDDNNQLQPYQVGLPTGGENLTADFGYIKPSSIGDFVWYDSNRDGIQDVGEPGIPNVTLDLYQDTDGTPGLNTATDTKVGSTVTDADGGYLFSGMGPGTYFVDVTDTNGKLTGLDHIVANQSQPDPTNPIVLTSGTVYKDADFGYVHPLDGKAIVGDTVWFDYNGDGRQQPGEPGIPNVTVTVYDSNNNPVGTADTDQNGRYFIPVTPGSGYTVSPDRTDIPAGLTTTTPVPHQLPPLNAGDRYLDADFGYNGAGLGTIGNLVWADADNSGAVNGSERGLPGVSVDLIRDLNGNKIWETGEPIIATDTTDQDGGYLFTGLPADTYLVHVSDTNAALFNYVKTKLGTAGANNNNQADPYAITLPAGGDNLTADFGYRKVDPKLGQIGNQVWIEFADGIFNPADGDIDFGQAGVTVDLYKDGAYVGRTTTGASGDYLFPSLSGGTYTVTVSDIHQVLKGYVVSVLGPNPGADNNNQQQPYQVALSQGGENMTADFAYTLKGALGDYVFYDSDKDGVQDVGEKGIGNVTLDLYKDNGDNSLNLAQDSLIGTATTDNDGGYLFTGLGQGVYFVDVTDTAGVLAGLTHTVGPQSQPDPSNAITLNTGDVYRDADFGYVKVPTPGKAIIGDTVWYDGDGDGVQDPGEPGLPGIQVCATPVGGGAAVCDTTDENGVYQVEVPAGTYTVAPVNPPAGYTPTTPVPNGPVTVSDGDQYLDADFGYDSPALGTISGTLWDDSPDKDGVLDPGEAPIPGVSVSLIKDTNGNGQRDPGEPIIATDTTDENGTYLFDGVPAGTYLVLPTDTQNVLDDFQATKPGPNPGSDNNSQVRPYPVTLPPGGNNPTGDFGYVRESGQTGILGNQVWYETDGNGIYNPDSGDKGIAGVTVDLYKNGAYLATTTTGAGGDYVFTSLAAATYTVTVSDTAKVLEDYILTVLGPVAGSDNHNQKQAYQVVLPAASSNMTADFGYTRPSSIGDLVWYDADKDGIQDVGEPGIPNVTVNLYRNGVLQATTTTDADGGYIFPGLVAGTYTVDVTDTNGKLTGMTQIVANQGQPDPTGPITIGAGVKYADADFAYVKPTTAGKAIIGDTVWFDDNGDGVQQPNEPGIPNTQVCATLVGGGTVVCATTDSNGVYRLEVPAGTYTVQPTNPPAGFTATTPVPHGPVTVDAGEQYLDADFGYDDPGQNLLGTIGNLVFLEAKATKDGLYNGTDKPLAGVSVDLIRDTNGNKKWDAGEPIIATTTTAGVTDAFSGNYLFTGLLAGNYLVHVSDTNAVLLDYKKTILGPNPGLDNNNQVDAYAIALGAGGDNLTADFGYYRTERPNVGVLGNQVWTEKDGNGLFDVNSGDMGQAGVTVKLLKDGALVGTTTTGPSGDYSFVGLPAGNYTTQVTDDLHVLASYIVTKLGPNQGSDNNNQLQPYATALATGGVNLTGDFGYILPAAIGDFVYYDTDKDGIQDIGEPGLPNVAVNLYRDTNNNGVLNIGTDENIQSTVTDADGGYLFRDLVPGKYIVDVTLASNPNGNLDTLVHTLGSQSATDPTPAITLVGGMVYKDADFGYVQPTTQGKAIIGDTIWYDANGDGVQQPEEPGIPGITVRATDSNGNTYTAVTDETGTYRLEVPQGTYTVQPVNPPAGLTVTTDPIWGPEILLAGEQRLDADFGYKDNNDLFGSIGNLVFWDKNHDGLYNSGDVALGGVSVDLIRDTNGNKVWDVGEPIIATATTKTAVDANTGNYLFPAVVAGNYLVHVSDTNAVLFDFEKSVLGASQTANNTNKADPYAIALGVNQDNLTADFGYYRQPNQPKVGVIGNQIWLESDLNGLFDVLTKDRGQAGVTVDLYEGGVKLATTTSGASGDYSFVHLPSGTYTVAVSDNAGILTGLDVTTLGPAQGSDNNNELQPYTVGLAEGGVNLTADFGYKDEPGGDQNAAQIGNMVWSDANNNGVFNTGEVAIGSVVVKLWFDTDSNCTLNSTTDVFVGNRTTANSLAVGNTNYLFEYPNGLRPGNYLVEVTDPNFVLVGATKTTGPTAGSNENSQANPYCIQNFNAAGTGDTNLTADFGYLLPDSRFMVTKVLLSPSPVRPQEAIQFSIRITNTGATQFMTLPLADTYDVTYIKYVSGTPASVDNNDDGVINWTDLLSSRGPLLPGQGVEVIVNFIALKDTGELPNDKTINTANVAGIITDPDGSGPAPTNPTPLPPQSSQDAVIIINPTAVTLANSQAAWVGAEVAVTWQTVSESDVAGFNLLRTDANGVVVTLNPLSIPAKNAGQAEGADYRWVDVTAQAEMVYTYTLEIIRLDGSTQPFELGRVQPGSVIFLPLILR